MAKKIDYPTHLDEDGRAHIVDISEKEISLRVATASASVRMNPRTLGAIQSETVPKGDVFAVARVAGIMAAKKCADIIPLCHPLALSSVEISLTPDPELPGVIVQAICKVSGRTGVEMEAMTSVSVAALTLYDMCKSMDRGITISDIKLIHKSGGISGEWKAECQD